MTCSTYSKHVRITYPFNVELSVRTQMLLHNEIQKNVIIRNNVSKLDKKTFWWYNYNLLRPKDGQVHVISVYEVSQTGSEKHDLGCLKLYWTNFGRLGCISRQNWVNERRIKLPTWAGITLQQSTTELLLQIHRASRVVLKWSTMTKIEPRSSGLIRRTTAEVLSPNMSSRRRWKVATGRRFVIASSDLEDQFICENSAADIFVSSFLLLHRPHEGCKVLWSASVCLSLCISQKQHVQP